jgi:hypothetical protein
MWSNRISIMVAGAALALAGTFAAAPSALAAPASGHPAAGAQASQAGPLRVIRSIRGRFVIGVRRSGASPDGTAGPLQETFTCTINYGISSVTPIYNKKNQVVAYEAHYGISDQCEIPMTLIATIFFKDLNTGRNANEDATGQPFSEDINLDSSARLAVKNSFVAQYDLSSTLLPGFEWISTTAPFNCFGIGTMFMQCSFNQPYST